METTIRINTDLLNKIVDIIIQPSDDTDYILSNPAYANELQERIAEYHAKKKAISLKPDELL